jgi:hypothetical protein
LYPLHTTGFFVAPNAPYTKGDGTRARSVVRVERGAVSRADTKESAEFIRYKLVKGFDHFPKKWRRNSDGYTVVIYILPSAGLNCTGLFARW